MLATIFPKTAMSNMPGVFFLVQAKLRTFNPPTTLRNMHWFSKQQKFLFPCSSSINTPATTTTTIATAATTTTLLSHLAFELAQLELKLKMQQDNNANPTTTTTTLGQYGNSAGQFGMFSTAG